MINLELSEFSDWLQAAKALEKDEVLKQINTNILSSPVDKKGVNGRRADLKQIEVDRNNLLMMKQSFGLTEKEIIRERKKRRAISEKIGKITIKKDGSKKRNRNDSKTRLKRVQSKPR